MNTSVPVKRRRGRPPKDQAAHSETRASLIRSGLELLTEKGYSSTGIDEILRRVGVPKGSFYHFFASKDAFGLELIHHYSAFFNHKLDKFLLDQSLTPLTRIKSFIEDSIKGMEHYDFRRGCLVGNLGQEMGALPESFRKELMMVFEEWQTRLQTCLVEAQREAEISSDIDCKEAAYLFWTGWEGAVLRSKLEQSPSALEVFSNYFLRHLR